MTLELPSEPQYAFLTRGQRDDEPPHEVSDLTVNLETGAPTRTGERFRARVAAMRRNPNQLGAWLDDFAKLVLNFLIVVLLAEVFMHKRVVSDALMIGLLIMAFGWWSTVRTMRREAAQELTALRF